MTIKYQYAQLIGGVVLCGRCIVSYVRGTFPVIIRNMLPAVACLLCLIGRYGTSRLPFLGIVPALSYNTVAHVAYDRLFPFVCVLWAGKQLVSLYYAHIIFSAPRLILWNSYVRDVLLIFFGVYARSIKESSTSLPARSRWYTLGAFALLLGGWASIAMSTPKRVGWPYTLLFVGATCVVCVVWRTIFAYGTGSATPRDD